MNDGMQPCVIMKITRPINAFKKEVAF